jgi:hypothetical protein
MSILRTVMGICLCVVGVLFVLFELAMAGSEPHSFLTGGWVPFLVFLVLGAVIFLGGLLLLWKC